MAFFFSRVKYIFQDYSEEIFCLFGPCIEVSNETAFLTKNPIDIVTSGDYNKVPMIIGYNSNEGLVVLFDQISTNSTISDQNINFERFIPYQMKRHLNDNMKKEIEMKLMQIYSNDRPGDKFLVSTISSASS